MRGEITDWLAVAINFGTLLVLFFTLRKVAKYAEDTERMAEAAAAQHRSTQQQLKLMEQQLDASLLPIVVIRADVPPQRSGEVPHVTVSFRNVGTGPAINVLRQDAAGRQGWEEGLSSVIVNPLAAGEESAFDLRLAAPTVVRVRYESLRGRRFVSSAPISPGIVASQCQIVEVPNDMAQKGIFLPVER